MAQRGGKRVGAGRKAGASNKRTKEAVAKAAELGLSPLDVMLEAMKEAYENGGAKAAFPFAKDAAPYLHAKLSATDVNLATQKGGLKVVLKVSGVSPKTQDGAGSKNS